MKHNLKPSYCLSKPATRVYKLVQSRRVLAQTRMHVRLLLSCLTQRLLQAAHLAVLLNLGQAGSPSPPLPFACDCPSEYPNLMSSNKEHDRFSAISDDMDLPPKRLMPIAFLMIGCRASPTPTGKVHRYWWLRIPQTSRLQVHPPSNETHSLANH